MSPSPPSAHKPRRRATPSKAKTPAVQKTEAAASAPPPAKTPLRFERGELPIHVLSLLQTYGLLRRPTITEACFTKAPTKLNKQRINGTIATLLTKGYATQLGTMRLYQYKITKEGKAFLKEAQKEPAKA